MIHRGMHNKTKLSEQRGSCDAKSERNEVDSNVAGDRSRAKGDRDRGKAAYTGKAWLSGAKGTHY